MRDKLTWSNLLDVLLIVGIVFLAYHNSDGWGWLTLLLFLKHA